MKKLILLLILVLTTMLSSVVVTQAATLSIGSSGTEIRTLQTDLKTLNYLVGSVDGIYGSQTKAAVQAFQRDANLTADGIVGTQTQTAISRALKPAVISTTSITSAAKEFIGVPYVWGGVTPAGFDCSGFTRYVFASQGISLPRVSKDQYGVGTAVTFNNLIPGDLVFFNLTSGTQVSHVGIYLGDGQFISATSSKGIAIYGFSPYWAKAYVGARRVS